MSRYHICSSLIHVAVRLTLELFFRRGLTVFTEYLAVMFLRQIALLEELLEIMCRRYRLSFRLATRKATCFLRIYLQCLQIPLNGMDLDEFFVDR
jgi:hypothetical protein